MVTDGEEDDDDDINAFIDDDDDDDVNQPRASAHMLNQNMKFRPSVQQDPVAEDNQSKQIGGRKPIKSQKIQSAVPIRKNDLKKVVNEVQSDLESE